MGPVIGIDLGTLSSCVAVVRGRTPLLIASHGGQKATPSTVTITRTGQRIVGLLAKRQATTNAENTVSHTKRLIGKADRVEVVRELLRDAAYPFSEGADGELRIRIRDQSYRLAEIAAMILDEMRRAAERFLCQDVGRAVIAVPAHFNEAQRATIREAGALADLEVLKIIDEPAAAAIAHGLHTGAESTVAVYDLGGGGFHCSVMRFRRGAEPELLGTVVDEELSGEQFDERIVRWLLRGFEQKHGIDLRRDRMAMQRLKDGVERARCELSFARETEVTLPYLITSTEGMALHLRQPISRARFEDLTGDLVDRSLALTEKLLADVGLSKERIDHLVLSGGVTRTPGIRREVATLFGREPEEGPRPDEVVALGAAIAGALLDRPARREEVATQELVAPASEAKAPEITAEMDTSVAVAAERARVILRASADADEEESPGESPEPASGGAAEEAEETGEAKEP